MPRFLERDEAEREPPCDAYPWDGVRNVRPFSRFATTVVEGVQFLQILTIPILRHGAPYKSLDVVRVPHHRTREPFVEISQANGGLIRRDLREDAQAEARRALAAVPFDRLIEISARAARHFLDDRLPLGEGQEPVAGRLRAAAVGDDRHAARAGAPQHGQDRRRADGAALGAARPDARARSLDPRRGHGEHEGQALSFYPRTQALGVVLPSNSPGVHSLWVPAIALKMPLVLKPGSAEPWTPFRIAQAFIKAGCPPEAFSYYPSDHAGAGEILRRTGRSMFFGDVAAVGGWEGDPRVEIHGPGYSKVLIGDDRVNEWEQHVDLVAGSIADNGGRSCVNASGVWVTASHAERFAEALAAKLARIVPRAAEDDQAQLAPFADPKVAERISNQIDAGLSTPGARDVTASHRGTPRLVTLDGCTYLLPTVVLVRQHRPSAREPRVPVSVCRGREGLARRDGAGAGADGEDARRDGAHERSRAHRPAARVAARRSAQRRPDRDQPHQLGSAARGQPVRASLRPAIVPVVEPAARHATAGAGVSRIA